MSANHNKLMLIILDGWGIGKKDHADAIYNANTPNFDSFIKNYPNSQLSASGEDVGLPKGQMGNSEVGHLNIGAGRVVYQDLVKINKDIERGTFFKNGELNDSINYAKRNGKKVHLIGLLSNGGVHSSIEHLFALCDLADKQDFDELYIHALMDGRDCDPRSGLGFVKELVDYIENSKGRIASICGRYYTMDRDKRWERVKVGYDLLVHGKGEPFTDPVVAVETSYSNEITDEFIKPISMVDEKGEPLGKIQKDDVVICFNFRTDRLREITTVLTQKDMPEYDMQTIPIHYLTMTNYDDTFKGISVVYTKDNLKGTLGETVSGAGLKQLRIAETEKYAHVTFFFSGGREEEFPGESRILIPSPKVATYDLQPEMSAYLVTDEVLTELKARDKDFICLNYANGDMVGHTGVYKAIIKAVEAVDECLGRVIETAQNSGYQVMIIADHGNADKAINGNGSENTAHSLNPVPCILISSEVNKIDNGRLCDVAPTILKLMKLEIPKEMEGRVLVK